MFWSVCEEELKVTLQLIRSTYLFGGLLAGVQSDCRVCVCCKLKQVACRWDAGSYQTACCVSYIHISIRCLLSQYSQPFPRRQRVHRRECRRDTVRWLTVKGEYSGMSSKDRSCISVWYCTPRSICKGMWRFALRLQCRERLVIN